ncbi:MAG: methylmalonyl Co-A mutase-associated GTPase MeaB [Cyclobacteriaceae bacterium]
MSSKRSRLSPNEYFDGIRGGDRVLLSRSITLVESTLAADQQIADELMELILPFTGSARRIGITGVPGVGKSTFIESFGKQLIGKGEKIAVLTIDPTSSKSRGSILGDKTRMESLSKEPDVYIRPSAAGNALGGVANATREAMLLCEAAGYTTIIVETVGVGQSETNVRNMVDFFLLLMLAGAGDELQGIKKGIMEMADAIAITKADGSNRSEAEKAKKAYSNALHLFPPNENGWVCEVITTSAVEGHGISRVLEILEHYFSHMKDTGYLENLRSEQRIQWLDDLINYLTLQRFLSAPGIPESLNEHRAAVKQGLKSPYRAARELIELAWN